MQWRRQETQAPLGQGKGSSSGGTPQSNAPPLPPGTRRRTDPQVQGVDTSLSLSGALSLSLSVCLSLSPSLQGATPSCEHAHPRFIGGLFPPLAGFLSFFRPGLGVAVRRAGTRPARPPNSLFCSLLPSKDEPALQGNFEATVD